MTIAATSTTPWDGVADHGLNGHTSGGGADGAVVHAVALGCDVGTATAVRARTSDTKGSGIPELTSLPELPLQPSALMHSSPPEALEGVHVHLAGCM